MTEIDGLGRVIDDSNLYVTWMYSNSIQSHPCWYEQPNQPLYIHLAEISGLVSMSFIQMKKKILWMISARPELL